MNLSKLILFNSILPPSAPHRPEKIKPDVFCYFQKNWNQATSLNLLKLQAKFGDDPQSKQNINPFQANVYVLYLLKTSENL